MEKNENGFPQRSKHTPHSTEGAGSCDGSGGRLPEGDVSLAYVYAPMQRFCMLYSDGEALNHGTLFEELYKPMEVYAVE